MGPREEDSDDEPAVKIHPEDLEPGEGGDPSPSLAIGCRRGEARQRPREDRREEEREEVRANEKVRGDEERGPERREGGGREGYLRRLVEALKTIASVARRRSAFNSVRPWRPAIACVQAKATWLSHS